MNSRLTRFMMGRYGRDELSTFLLVVAVALALIAQFAKLPFLAFISYLPLGIAIFRILSKILPSAVGKTIGLPWPWTCFAPI